TTTIQQHIKNHLLRMASKLGFITLFLVFLLLAGNTSARKDKAGEYWRGVMNDQPLPESINSMIVAEPLQSNSDDDNGVHCTDDAIHVMKFTEEIVSQPQISSYGEDVKLGKYAMNIKNEPQISNYGNNVKTADKFIRDVESQPQISNYDHNNAKFLMDLESSQPQISSYGAAKHESNKFLRDIMPQPQISRYDDNYIELGKVEGGINHQLTGTSTGKFVRNIESQPQISKYSDDSTPNNKFVKDLKSQPQISSYGVKNIQNKLKKDIMPQPQISRYDDNGVAGSKTAQASEKDVTQELVELVEEIVRVVVV
ncbi:Organ-specific protein S2, partial [Linum perenne]